MKKILITTIIAIVGAQNLVLLQAQTIIYVKPTGTGNGSSWANACNLECVVGHDAGSRRGEACLAPTTNAQIWVQKGTYYPSAMLFVPNSVKMYGGFEGTESNLSQRDSLSNATIIDAQQQYGSVVRVGVSAELNGFVVQNGHANDNPHVNGGGVFADDHSVISNCLIINNAASVNGGGVYAKGPVKIINSTVQDNIASGNGYNIFSNCLTLSAVGEGLSDKVSSVAQESPECTAPVISYHPSTTAQVKETNAAFSALSVSAMGTPPFTYRWYSNETNSNSNGTLVGVTASYTPSSTTIGSLYYYCVVSNACGSATSNVSGVHTVGGCAPGSIDLGTVGFISSATHTVGGQTWSAPVTASGCGSVSAFNGGSSGAYRTVCAKNSTYGDLFSWCAVIKYANTLCPAPWRVPTKDEFINLDKAFGGTGENRSASSYVSFINTNYIGKWGAVYGGYAYAGTLGGQGMEADYWSQTESTADYGYTLYLHSSGLIYPQHNSWKYYGFTLRCVR